MPIVTIGMRKGRSATEKKRIFDAVHNALVAAFKIPDRDRSQKIVEFDEDNFEIPQGNGTGYTVVEIAVFPGRTREAKKELYHRMVENMADAGIPSSDLFIVLNEQPLDNWGIRGGNMASDVQLGYNLKV